MKTKTETILIVMNVLTWIAFVGLMIEAGAVLVSWFVSLVNEEAAKNLYMRFDLSSLKQSSVWLYSISLFFKFGLLSLKALAAYLVIEILWKLNIINPFTVEISRRIEKMSYVVLSAGILALVSDGYHNWLNHRGFNFPQGPDPGEFLFLAGILFIVAQTFKKGVELQSENELTI